MIGIDYLYEQKSSMVAAMTRHLAVVLFACRLTTHHHANTIQYNNGESVGNPTKNGRPGMQRSLRPLSPFIVTKPILERFSP